MGEGHSDKLKNWLQLFLAVAGVIGVIWGVISSITNNVVTDNKLQEHNTNEKSHPSIVRNVGECEGKVEALSKRVEESHDTEVAIGARLVRLLAADTESNRNLKAAAANYYENEFRHKVRKGLTVEEAILEALREPYYTRYRSK